jgi:hypothetical protein
LYCTQEQYSSLMNPPLMTERMREEINKPV